MIFGRESFRKKNNGKYLIGYQLSPETAQISFLRIGEDQPYTFSMVAGMEDYNLPLCLYRQEEGDLWSMGKEAIEKGETDPQGMVDQLLEKVYRREQVELSGQSYDSRALLALFVKKSLALLRLETSLEQVAAIVFVVDWLDADRVTALREMTEYLQLPRIEMQLMSKEESFFWYNLHTDQSLWKGQVMLYEMEKNSLISFRLWINPNTTPLVTMIEKKIYPQWEGFAVKSAERKDEFFLQLCREDFQNGNISAVYLIGDGFGGDWYQESLRFICKLRRVFRGNNLYSKGACQGLLQKLEPDKLAQTYVYLGEDKLCANVGMNLLRQGEESYLAVLNGGNNWYDSRKEWEVILEKDNQLVFRITPLNGRNIVEHVITLGGLKSQGQPYTRIHVKAWMSSPRKLQVKAADKGFGQFYPSTNRVWEETIEL